MSAQKSVLILTGDCAEALEVMYPLQRLREAGVRAVVATPHGKKIRSVVHDFEEGCETYTEKLGYGIPADIAFDKVVEAEFDGLVIPGGRAPEYIRTFPRAIAIVNHFMAANKPVAAICHAAQLLGACNCIKGRKVSAYPALQCDVESAGGIFTATLDFSRDEAVVDGNLVTARAWPDHPAFMREFMKLLG